MNWEFQRNQIKPTAKSCEWCRHFDDNFQCTLNAKKAGELSHRLVLKLIKESDFRYCKNYRYSKVNFVRYKEMCKENREVTKELTF